MPAKKHAWCRRRECIAVCRSGRPDCGFGLSSWQYSLENHFCVISSQVGKNLSVFCWSAPFLIGSCGTDPERWWKGRAYPSICVCQSVVLRLMARKKKQIPKGQALSLFCMRLLLAKGDQEKSPNPERSLVFNLGLPIFWYELQEGRNKDHVVSA